MPTSHGIGQLARSKLSVAAAAMARAFRDYPILSWLIPDSNERASFTASLTLKAIEYGLRYGVVYSDVNASGTAIWLPPDENRMTLSRLLLSGYFFVPFRLGINRAYRFIKFNMFIEKVRERQLPSEHWYFFMMGVDPSQSGAGIGDALIRYSLSCNERQRRLPSYMETHMESNVPYFEKRGFKLVQETETMKGAPHNWSMIHNPS